MDILDLPFFYNLRFLVAGDQSKTREFIKKNYQKYKCRSVIDLGCGTGDFSTIFEKKQYLGIDISNNYINFAKSKYGYNFLKADVTKYKFEKLFDCALFISTMHHLSYSQIEKIFSNAIKITKKIIIIIDLNPETDIIRWSLIKMDRGNYVRSTNEKLSILNKYGKVLKIKHFNTRLASQTGIILKPK